MPAFNVLTATGVAAWISLLFMNLVKQGHALGCYRCTSTNGSNSNCEDPFNSIDQVYDRDCFAPRPGHKGLFPGTQCLKMTFCKYTSRGELCSWIRTCVADNGGMNSDSEIGRTDHCGLGKAEIMLDNTKVYGCITSCKGDGCNTASNVSPAFGTLLTCFVVSIFSRNMFIPYNE